jgi:uncharacterized protein DUF3466
MNKFLKSVLVLSVSSAIATSTVYAATYQVVDRGRAASHKYTSAQAQNSSGVMTISASQVYNFPVQFDVLTEDDFKAIESLAFFGYEADPLLADIEDGEALRAGTPTANDLAWVVKYLQESSKVKSNLYQKVGNNNVMLNDGTTNSEVVIFDQALADGNLSRSTTDYVYGVTNDNWVYGRASAPYLPVDFTDSNDNTIKYWIQDFVSKGYISLNNGNIVKEITPPETRFGGESALLNINDNYVGVGYVSTSVKQSMLDYVNDETGGCADPDVLKNTPVEICVWQRQQLEREGIYSLQATKFTFDQQGDVISSESLGNLVTPHVDDTRVYKSYAQAINNNGVAVGFAFGWTTADVTTPKTNESRSQYAVVYKDGNAISFTKEPRKEFDSRAFDINDAGIAVGYVTKSVNGNNRTKFYYVDTNAADLTMVFPGDFFTGSASTAKAINEQGFIVGDGEVETHNDSSTNPRRRHGFLYDINNDKFTDLNDFLSCNNDYTIIKANGINEVNEISATAVVKVDRRDARGELSKDADGNQLTEDVFRAVTLQPITGEIEDCSKVEEKVARQGASFGWFSLLLLMPLAFRRKFQN